GGGGAGGGAERAPPRPRQAGDPNGLPALPDRVDGPFDRPPIDAARLVRVPDEQAVIGQDVDAARDTVRVLGDARDGVVQEQARVGAAGDPQPAGDILAGFLSGQWAYRASQADALAELAELWPRELVSQLRLPDEQDLKQLRVGRLEVREQAQVLEGRRGEVLRLVDDDEGGLALAPALDQESIEREE